MKTIMQIWRNGLCVLLVLVAMLGLARPVAAQPGGFVLPARKTAGMTPAVQDETPQIRVTQVDNSHFPKVTVYISVTNAAGEPLGVDPSQIQLSENGQQITPDEISGKGEIGALTTILVVDVSGSMFEAGKLKSAKDAAKAYVDQMRPDDQAGLLAFNTKVQYIQKITSDKQQLITAIDSLKAENDTAMYDALSQAADILKDVSGRKAIIVITDGLDNISKVKADDVIQTIGPSGLSISTIGLGNPGESGLNSGLDEAGLKSLAERAGGGYGYANDPQTLANLYERYGRALQSEYTITYTSPSTLRDGVNRKLTVSLASLSDAKSVEAQYNPGGVLPEVGQTTSWPIFGAILAGLLLLFILPRVISRGAQALSTIPGGTKKSKRSGKLKLSESPPAHKANVKLK